MTIAVADVAVHDRAGSAAAPAAAAIPIEALYADMPSDIDECHAMILDLRRQNASVLESRETWKKRAWHLENYVQKRTVQVLASLATNYLQHYRSVTTRAEDCVRLLNLLSSYAATRPAILLELVIAVGASYCYGFRRGGGQASFLYSHIIINV